VKPVHRLALDTAVKKLIYTETCLKCSPRCIFLCNYTAIALHDSCPLKKQQEQRPQNIESVFAFNKKAALLTSCQPHQTYTVSSYLMKNLSVS